MSMMQLIIAFLLIGFANLAVIFPPAPAPDNAALMARYIIHNTGWVSLATISLQNEIKGYPFVSLKSFSDGPGDNGTGIPYLYMTDMDVSGKDIEVDNRVTIMASLAEEVYCKSKHFDPQDPRCAKVMITGRLRKVPKNTPEYSFGKEALFEKHPSMKDWPTNHNFYVARLHLENIAVLDFFGGIKHVAIKDYFHPNITTSLFLITLIPQVSIIDVQV